ncbi:hypothetical protein [Sphingobacterium detergens]|uniref:Uncharacterized protein n=1 Tax=Sphingobacterium detergens TaxID=1145106 RepID=A0A420ARR9_SPHD1|nr:hypothetical protein [Sphingobacterium detergens]RKE47184.1 hypothetical protein DFQ12_4348 [Sphingobacterium detergens]
MRIREQDISSLVAYLEQRQQDGRYLLSFDTSATYLNIEGVRA